MSEDRQKWSFAAKLFTVSALCLLLSFGLCSVGPTDFFSSAGLLLAITSCIGLLVSLFLFVLRK
jgi:hypothetical protein